MLHKEVKQNFLVCVNGGCVLFVKLPLVTDREFRSSCIGKSFWEAERAAEIFYRTNKDVLSSSWCSTGKSCNKNNNLSKHYIQWLWSTLLIHYIANKLNFVVFKINSDPVGEDEVDGRLLKKSVSIWAVLGPITPSLDLLDAIIFKYPLH